MVRTVVIDGVGTVVGRGVTAGLCGCVVAGVGCGVEATDAGVGGVAGVVVQPAATISTARIRIGISCALL